jgi:hypothetical protein
MKDRGKKIIFGQQEKREDNHFETLGMVVKWLRESAKSETAFENTECVARLGGGRGERPVLIKFSSFSKKLEVLENKRNLVGFKVRVGEHSSIEVRRTGKELVSYLKDTK